VFKVSRYVESGSVSMISDDDKYEGLWWINSNPDNLVSGTLHITLTGIWLIINGTFNTDTHRMIPELLDHEIILGVQSSGFRFTLEKCIGIENKSPLGNGYNTQAYSIDFVYSGINIKDVTSLKFDNYFVGYTYLHDWLRNVGLGIPDITEGGYFIEYNSDLSTTISSLIANVEDAIIEFKSAPSLFSDMNSVEIKIEEIINIKCKSAITVENANKLFLEPLRDFLSLATTRPNMITSFSINLNEREIPVYFKSPYQNEERASLFNKGVILFYAKAIHLDPTHYLKKWFSLEKEMRDVCEMFFGVHYNQQGFSTNRFLNVVQALEAYSRARQGAKKFPKNDYSERVKMIMDKAPAEYKEWLHNTLSNSNYKTLRDFLSTLIKDTQPLLNNLIPDQKVFISWVIDTRNYLTHLDVTGKKKIAREDDLNCLIYSLIWVLRVHFLFEIGFDSTQCSELLCENRLFKDLCEYQAPWK
jgi:hypothetical protein